MQFTTYIFKNKEVLKGNDLKITESLIKEPMAKLNKARETYSFNERLDQ